MAKGSLETVDIKGRKMAWSPPGGPTGPEGESVGPVHPTLSQLVLVLRWPVTGLLMMRA